MAKGITVVVPPQAAERVPERKSSQVSWPSQACWSIWQWLSIPPGVTSKPAASSVSSARPRSSPRAAMRPSRIAMSQRKRSLAVATMPLRMMTSNVAGIRQPPRHTSPTRLNKTSSLPSMIDELQFFPPPRHESLEGFGDGGVQRRRLVGFERGLPDPCRALRRIEPAGELPVLVILPVGDERLIEGRFVACQRMGRAEEMPAGGHAGDGLQPLGQLLRADVHGLDGLGHHLQHLDVEHDLLEGGGEP